MDSASARDFKAEMLETFSAHGISDAGAYLAAVQNAQERKDGTINEQDFKRLSVQYGLDERLFNTYSLLVAKIYADYQETAIEAAYFSNLNDTQDSQASPKNAWLAIAAFVVVGFVAYQVFQNAPPGSAMGGLKDWIGHGMHAK